MPQGGVNIALLTALGGLAACKVRSDSLGEGAVKASGSGKIRERKSLWDLQANSPDIILYKAAIDKMVSVPQEKDGSYDPMSWEGQARIHMDSCPHGNAYFLPWHRQYLYDFESVINYWARQAAASNPDVKAVLDSGHEFALPYWDWTRTDPATGRFGVPQFFLDDPGFNHATFHEKNAHILSLGYESRSTSPGFDAEFMGTDAIAGVMASRDFASFGGGGFSDQMGEGTYGSLEGTPHNNVHVAVGGDMGAMLSPRDPIFWMHHCNVDRLWAEWAKKMGDKASRPKGEDLKRWNDYELYGYFAFTEQEGGYTTAPKTVKVNQLFDTKVVGYTYDSLEKGAGLSLAGREVMELSRVRHASAKATRIYQRDSDKNGAVDRGFENSVFMKFGPIAKVGTNDNFDILRDFITFKGLNYKQIKVALKGLPIPPEGAKTVQRIRFGFASDNRSNFYEGMLNFAFFGVHDLAHRQHMANHGAFTVNIEYDLTDRIKDQLVDRSGGPFDFGSDGQLTMMMSIHDRTVLAEDGTPDRAVATSPTDLAAYLAEIKKAELTLEISGYN